MTADMSENQEVRDQFMFTRGFTSALQVIADWIETDMPPSAGFLRREVTRLNSEVADL